MIEVKDATFCFVDHGLNVPMAIRFAKEAKRVLYYSPWEKGFPLVTEAIVGDGFDNLERCDDWMDPDVIKDVDCFVFPDLQHSGAQHLLEYLGKPVWGSKSGDSYELNRVKFHKTLERLGLDCPKWRVINGLTNLRLYLQEHEDCHVKISRWRGMMETWRHTTYDESRPKLDQLAVKFGPLQDHIPFIVVDHIETELELGIDTYLVNGRYPSVVCDGPEIKDQCYLCAIHEVEEIDEGMLEILDKFSEELGKERYTNFFSIEARAVGDKRYFIDPCCRTPCPATEAQTALYTNLPKIVLAGAQGELVEPEYEDTFAAQIILTMKGDKSDWGVVDIPDKAKEWVSLGGSCEVDGRTCFPPDGSHGHEIGWLVATAKSPSGVLDVMKERAALFSGTGITADIRPLIDALQEIQSAEDQGIPFSDEPIPEPAEVLE